jgi:trimethylamine:corrinoid methyltransferase-like protein
MSGSGHLAVELRAAYVLMRVGIIVKQTRALSMYRSAGADARETDLDALV